METIHDARIILWMVARISERHPPMARRLVVTGRAIPSSSIPPPSPKSDFRGAHENLIVGAPA
jgi:hypothetical protein